MRDGLESSSWHALRVRSRHEKIAQTHLSSRGYVAFAALYRRTTRWSDRQRNVEIPLFPGYVFCRFDPHHRLPVLSAPGVLHVVGTGSESTPIPEAEIAAVRVLIDSGLRLEPYPYLCVGDRVVVERGPLEGLEGIVLRMKSSVRIVMSVNMLERSVVAEVDRDSIRLLPSRQGSV